MAAEARFPRLSDISPTLYLLAGAQTAFLVLWAGIHGAATGQTDPVLDYADGAAREWGKEGTDVVKVVVSMRQAATVQAVAILAALGHWAVLVPTTHCLGAGEDERLQQVHAHPSLGRNAATLRDKFGVALGMANQWREHLDIKSATRSLSLVLLSVVAERIGIAFELVPVVYNDVDGRFVEMSTTFTFMTLSVMIWGLGLTMSNLRRRMVFGIDFHCICVMAPIWGAGMIGSVLAPSSPHVSITLSVLLMCYQLFLLVQVFRSARAAMRRALACVRDGSAGGYAGGGALAMLAALERKAHAPLPVEGAPPDNSSIGDPEGRSGLSPRIVRDHIESRLEAARIAAFVRVRLVAIGAIALSIAATATTGIIGVSLRGTGDVADTLTSRHFISTLVVVDGTVLPFAMLYTLALARQRLMSTIERLFREAEMFDRVLHQRRLLRYRACRRCVAPLPLSARVETADPSRAVCHEIRVPLNTVSLGLEALHDSLHGTPRESDASPREKVRLSSRSMLPGAAAGGRKGRKADEKHGNGGAPPSATGHSMQLLRSMEIATSSLVHVMDDMLDMEQVELASNALVMERFDTGALVSAVVESFRPLAKSIGIALHLRRGQWSGVEDGNKGVDGVAAAPIANDSPSGAEADASQHHVVGDSGRIAQVLGSLISNAIKFSSDGSNVVVQWQLLEYGACREPASEPSQWATDSTLASSESRRSPSPFRHSGPPTRQRDYTSQSKGPQPSARRLCVSVTDKGIGIDDTDLARLFRPFTRIQAGASLKGNVTGLGLAICRGICVRHGGCLHATSDGPGTGTTFAFEVCVKPYRAPAPRVLFRDSSVTAAAAGAPCEPGARPSPIAGQQRLRTRSFHPLGTRSRVSPNQDSTAASGKVASSEHAARQSFQQASSVEPQDSTEPRGSVDSFRGLDRTSRDFTVRVPPPLPLDQLVRTREWLESKRFGEELTRTPYSAGSAQAATPMLQRRSASRACDVGGAAAATGEAGQGAGGATAPAASGAEAPPSLPVLPASMVKAPTPARAGATGVTPPLLPAPGRSPASDAAHASGGSGSRVLSQWLAEHTVLVVEDVPSNRRLLKFALHRLGATSVLEAGDGVQALRVLEERGMHSVQAILTDKEMPQMGGVELLSELRARGYCGLLFGVTGSAEHSDVQRLFDAGALRVLTKPVTRVRLGEVLQEEVARAQRGEGWKKRQGV